MAGKIKLNNNQGDTITLEHSDTISSLGSRVIPLDNITHKVSTIAELRAMTERPEFVYVEAYDDSGSTYGAFGSHFFKRSLVVEADNGGTVIQSVSDTYELQYSGAVNVKWFGAKGDGVTNDKPAFELAIAIGKEVSVPTSKYRITTPFSNIATIKLTGVASSSNLLSKYTSSNSSTIVCDTGFTEATLAYDDNTRLELRDLLIVSKSYNDSTAHSTYTAFNILGGQFSCNTWENVYILGFYRSIWLESFGYFNMFKECIFTGDENAVSFNPLNGSYTANAGYTAFGGLYNRNTFDNCEFDDANTAVAIKFTTGCKGYGNNFINTHFEGPFILLYIDTVSDTLEVNLLGGSADSGQRILTGKANVLIEDFSFNNLYIDTGTAFIDNTDVKTVVKNCSFHLSATSPINRIFTQHATTFNNTYHGDEISYYLLNGADNPSSFISEGNTDVSVGVISKDIINKALTVSTTAGRVIYIQRSDATIRQPFSVIIEMNSGNDYHDYRRVELVVAINSVDTPYILGYVSDLNDGTYEGSKLTFSVVKNSSTLLSIMATSSNATAKVWNVAVRISSINSHLGYGLLQ